MTIFYVIAYGWGDTNGGQYLVWMGDDQSAACRMADAEAQERGGKYGCAVYKQEMNREGAEEMVHFSPALRGPQDRPRLNPRKMAADRIGLAVMSRIERGGGDTPAWLVEKAEFELLIAKTMVGDDGTCAQGPSPHPQPKCGI